MITMSAPFLVFFFNDTATTEIYTLSLHDALPISVVTPDGAHFTWTAVRAPALARKSPPVWGRPIKLFNGTDLTGWHTRSEEHTSELQSQSNLVCRLLLEKKKINVTLKHSHDV